MTVVAINFVKLDTPLVVDLDGTLIKSDLLVEAVFKRAGSNPASIFALLSALRHGKAHLKDLLAQAVDLDPASLPYDEAVLGLIREALAAGRPVYLASASNARCVSAIADHFGFFSGWFGSDATTNVSGRNKASLLVESFGERGFDYIGNDQADLHGWAAASKRIGIRTPARLNKQLAAIGVEVIDAPKPTLKTWLKLLRVHQYAKNSLVFLPLFAAHRFDFGSLLDCVLATIAFSLCASSVYIFNDLVDLSVDRGHLPKKNRPLASGAIPILHGVTAMPVLFFCATALAAFVSLPFLGVLMFYFALTNAYTCWLKRKMLIDVVVLPMLYTLRVIGGAAAIGVMVSEWLLAFSMFIFASLALIKRYIELSTRLDRDLPDRQTATTGRATCKSSPHWRERRGSTRSPSSPSTSPRYGAYARHPQFLWLICPILMYWVGRMLMMAHRRLVHYDPIVFALKDRTSLIAGVCIAAAMLAAI